MATWLPTLHREDEGWHLQLPAVRRAIQQLRAIGGHASTRPVWLNLPFGTYQLPFEVLHAVTVQYYEQVSDPDLECISAFSRIDCLRLRGTPITGDVLRFVRHPRRMWMLDLAQSNFDDEHAEELLRFERVQHVFLDSTRISDAAVETLLRLPMLDSLAINHCQIGPESIRRLASHPRLTYLHASPDQIQAPDALQLQRKSNDRLRVQVTVQPYAE